MILKFYLIITRKYGSAEKCFYLNLVNKKSQWERPTAPASKESVRPVDEVNFVINNFKPLSVNHTSCYCSGKHKSLKEIFELYFVSFLQKCHVLHILLKDFRSEEPFFKGRQVKRKSREAYLEIESLKKYYF